MSYSHGQTVRAADYNALAGLTGTAAGNGAAATAVAGYLWGIGYGDRGYGQSSPALTALSAGNTAQSWSTLQTVVSNLCSWQNTSTTALPSAAQVAAGAPIVAHQAGDSKSFPDILSTLDTNRLNYQIGNMTLTSSAASTTRSTTWNTFIQCVFGTSFASENAARHFFNTGGELRLALAHPNTGSPQDIDWNTMLNNLNIAFRAHSTTKLSGNGTGSSIGYYELTTSWQQIFTVSGSGAYSANSLGVYAKAASIAGVNGAKGTYIEIACNFNEDHANAYYDVAQAGTVATLSHLRATGSPLTSAIAAPSCSTDQALG